MNLCKMDANKQDEQAVDVLLETNVEENTGNGELVVKMRLSRRGKLSQLTRRTNIIK